MKIKLCVCLCWRGRGEPIQKQATNSKNHLRALVHFQSFFFTLDKIFMRRTISFLWVSFLPVWLRETIRIPSTPCPSRWILGKHVIRHEMIAILKSAVPWKPMVHFCVIGWLQRKCLSFFFFLQKCLASVGPWKTKLRHKFSVRMA